jgi:uncharacterized protein YlxW (UPF0749 family)
MLSLQFRMVEHRRQQISNISTERMADLKARLAVAKKERDRLRRQLNNLRQFPLAYNIRKNGADKVALQGAGVMVTLRAMPDAFHKNAGIYPIDGEFILRVVNELRAAAAEALAIDGKRVIASTAIKSLPQPVQIKALGDPHTLATALNLRGGVVDTLQMWGIQVTIRKGDAIVIPAFKGFFHFTYAKPLEKPEHGSNAMGKRLSERALKE